MVKKRKSRKKQEKGIRRKSDFQLYVLWKSLPSLLRGQSKEIFAQYGFEDELVLQLFELKTQQDFQKKFLLNKNTLTKWNKRIEKEGLLAEKIMVWAKKLTANVISALYKKVIEEGDAQRTKLWLEFVEGWREKIEEKHTGEIGLKHSGKIETSNEESRKLLKLLVQKDKDGELFWEKWLKVIKNVDANKTTD